MTTLARRALGYGPGVALCLAVALAALGVQHLEEEVFARPYLEALVIAILFGMAIRTFWTPGRVWTVGIGFTAKTLLEVAVVLLGASLSVQIVLSVGPALLAGIVVVVAIALASSYAISRALGLPQKMAILVSSGNSICGNSAIAAVAPVIGASAQDVASSITFTAVLGVVVVLALPLLVPLAALSEARYGVLAGLTVYAVPQVLAATVPVGGLSVQIGTFVKLVRVLLLGPLVMALSLVAHRLQAAPGEARRSRTRLSLGKMVPWFIVGFLILMALRSLGLVPERALGAIAWTTQALTILAMAGLGLGVDAKVVLRAGGRVTLAVSLSLAVLIAISLALVLGGVVRE